MTAAGRRKLCAVGAIVIAGLALAPAAEAVTRYADDTGAATGNCLTEETACSISRATSSFGDTSEVIVLPGTYATAATVNVSGINVHGKAGAERPVINSTAPGAAVTLFGTGARLAEVEVNKTGGSFGAVFQAGGETLVERVKATSSIAFGTACFESEGVLRDSICLATGSDGQGVAASIAGGAGEFTPKLRNVTAVATGSGSEGIAFSSGAAGVAVNADAKSVIAQGAVDVFAANCNGGAGVSVTLANSNFATTGTSSTGGCQPATITAAGSATNQTAEPTFANLGGGDLHQAPSSVTIDAGATDADSGTTDFDLQPRSFDDAPDIGADEFVLASPALGATNPASGANDNQPEVTGTTAPGTTVELFASAACSGAPLAGGSSDAFAAPGLTVTVTDNSVTNIYARATDASSNRSACVGPLTYAEVTPVTQPPGGQTPGPGSQNPSGTVDPAKGGATAKCKKQKKRKGAKRKKCKKPKRK